MVEMFHKHTKHRINSAEILNVKVFCFVNWGKTAQGLRTKLPAPCRNSE